ncbi:MAG: tripartite tricarboxylate transporter substrate binding protein [Burkholderiales bacterium]|nr:tripartite tricarboxylate transporter substrate binding protein [Burkholderiales bacterium]
MKVREHVALIALLLAASAVVAQPYPAKPVRFVVGFPAGGTVDVVARGLAQRLSPLWGQPIVVDNRVGANGTIATDHVAKSAPDGLTVLMAFSSHAINPALYPKLGYDAQRDFVPITMIASVPNLLVVHPSMPVRTVRDLIALAKAHPEQITYASSGNGSPAHLSAELFKKMANVTLLHVAYKGGPPHIASVISGETSLVFTTVMLALPHLKTGRMRAIAVTTPQHTQVLPQVPSVAETLPGYESVSWYGVFVPRATPTAIAEKLHADITRVIQLPDFRAWLLAQGAEPVASGQAEFTAQVNKELAAWRKLVVEIGAKVE